MFGFMFEKKDTIGAPIPSVDVKKEGEACCVGCKVDEVIQALKASSDKDDQKLALYIKMAVDNFNYDQERAKQPKIAPC